MQAPLFSLTAPERAATRPPKNWIAVACAEHARRGRDEMQPGFMQVCHGQCAPLRRVQPGDRVAYYAPTLQRARRGERGVPVRSFVSIGIVLAGEPYAFDMGGFVPWRRNVQYLPAREAPILPLLDRFEFVEDRARWGARFRFGLFAVSDHDMALIADAMALDWPLAPAAPAH